MKKMTIQKTKDQIPPDLLRRIEGIEQWFVNHPVEKRPEKVALFDLDNTLLVGDCGDALFAQLKIDEQSNKEPLTIQKQTIPFSWKEYQQVLKTKGKVEAYSQIIRCMAGLPLDKLLETGRRVMNSNQKYLELEGVKIPVPYPHPAMQALIAYLKSLGYRIFIISATNQYMVRLVVREYFDIPENNIFGMVPTIYTHPEYGRIIGDEIKGPVTVVEGKVEVYRKNIGAVAPFISGGDSTTDIMMLNLTDPNGLIIWVGKDVRELDKIKKEIHHPETLFFFEQGAYE